MISNPYDRILLEKKVQTLRQRIAALLDAKEVVVRAIGCAKLALDRAEEELYNSRQLRMF